MFYLTSSYYTICWKHLKYQWDKNNFKKEKTHRPNTSSTWGILHRFIVKSQVFVTQLYNLEAYQWYSITQKKDIIYPVYMREREKERNVQLPEREEKPEMPELSIT